MPKVKFIYIVKINALFWGVWTFIQAFVLYYQVPQIGIYLFALNFSIHFTFPLFFLSLAIWFFCRWFKWQKIKPLPFFLIHFILANVFSALWLTIYYGSLYLVFGQLLYHFMDVPDTAGWQYPQGIMNYMVVVGFYYALFFYREVKNKELQEAQLRLLLKESEWKVLKAQLNPHFLFNALNSISALITTSPGSARKMLVRLSELLRHILAENPTQTNTLSTELAFAHQYLDLEKIRLQDRLTYQEIIDDSLLNNPIPAMMLQPLLENAIKHGVSNIGKGGWIRLSISRENGTIIGSVENSFENAATFSHKKRDPHPSTGLKNLQQRLALLYGKDVQFTAQPIPDQKVFRVQFNIPANGTRKL